jgi:glycosyltransferase involved in cell wall biosynthesis
MALESYRVLHLIHSQQRRGAEVFAAQLASCIEGHGLFKNSLCSLYNDNDDLPVGELPVFKLDGQSSIFRGAAINPQLVSRLYGTLRKFQPDLLVAHGSDTLKYSGSVRFLYRKAFTVYRNIGPASVWANSLMKVKLNRLFLSQMDAVVSVSEYTRRDFISVYGMAEERVACIPNGVDASDFNSGPDATARDQIRRELGVAPTEMALISVGNLSSEKGHLGLLPVVRDLRNAGLVDHLILLGDGPLRQELEGQARGLGLGNRVHFLGRRCDVARLLSAADLFVLPSKTEGMPAVLVEAGLAGLPSVAFAVGGVPEVIEHQTTGLLVTPGEYQEMRGAVATLCQDKWRRREMGEAARRRCLEYFSMQRVASEYEALFLKMLKDSTGERNGHSQKGNVSHKGAGSRWRREAT